MSDFGFSDRCSGSQTWFKYFCLLITVALETQTKSQKNFSQKFAEPWKYRTQLVFFLEKTWWDFRIQRLKRIEWRIGNENIFLFILFIESSSSGRKQKFSLQGKHCFQILTPTLTLWTLRGHTALKSILWETLFLDQLHDFSLLSLNSFLHLFLKSE